MPHRSSSVVPSSIPRRSQPMTTRIFCCAGLALQLSGQDGGLTTCELWSDWLDGSSIGGEDLATDVVADPAGGLVYATGQALNASYDMVTIAYDQQTGLRKWTAIYDGPAAGSDAGLAIALDPAGERVYVAGTSDGLGTGSDFVTIAYDATSGAELWVARHDEPACGPTSPSADVGVALALSPDASKLFVTGRSSCPMGYPADIITLGYDAAGTPLWSRRYDGAGHWDLAYGIAAGPVDADPELTRVYVTGYSIVGTTQFATTIAYTARAGVETWVARHHQPSVGYALALRPNGARVYVTGAKVLGAQDYDSLTLAYSALTGALVWSHIYGSPAKDDRTLSLAVAPDGQRLYLGGYTQTAGLGGLHYDALAIALDLASGTALWTTLYDSPASKNDTAAAIELGGASAERVFLTGYSVNASGKRDFLTYALDRLDGSLEWVMHTDFFEPSSPFTGGRALSVGAHGKHIFATGRSSGPSGSLDMTTVGYEADPDSCP